MDDSSDSFINVSREWQETGGLFPTKEQRSGFPPRRYIPFAAFQSGLYNVSSSE